MKYKNTEKILKNFSLQGFFDTYALYIYSKGEKELITSENANKDTYFDVASCGKIMVTSPLILKAVGEGLLSFDDTLEMFFENVPEEKKQVTVKQLLTHTSGIVRCEIPRGVAIGGHDRVAEHILDYPLAFPVGTDYTYSCNGFILLGFILEKIYKKPIEMIFEEKLKKPLGMTRTRFDLPEGEKNRAISHCRDSDGEFPADDENVYSMRGGAGSGAQFYSIDDAAKLAEAILKKSNTLYPEYLFEQAEKDYTPDYAEGRGLGYWIIDDRIAKNSILFPKGSFGHWGSTGTGFFIDRTNDFFVIFFTNMRRGMCYNMNYDYFEHKDKFGEVCRKLFAEIKNECE